MPVVGTDRGPVRGRVVEGMRQFLGIPYAAPPVGGLRWRPPRPAAGWTGPLEAFEHGSPCAQDTGCMPGWGYDSDSEDCLYLNVYAPAGTGAGDGLPVMFWIPGGGLAAGGANDYDPGALVRDGRVVFVSVNYRMNVFGFFSHPVINDEGHASGNYGIMDQQAALCWVRDNITAFGGDPGNVTVFGESAGAISALAHMVSPRSAGLFHKVILQSASVAATTMTASLESRERVGRDLASAAGCHHQSPDNLRALSVRALKAANAMPEGSYGIGRHHIGLVADGDIVPDAMRTLFTTGRFQHVPVINGVNRDEYTWFQAMVEASTGRTLADEDYEQAVAEALTGRRRTALLEAALPRESLPEILKRYPLSEYPGASRALSAVIGDCGLISAGGRRTTRMIGQYVPDVYAYEWDVPDSPVAWPAVSFPYGSAHVQELQYLFPRFRGGGGTAQDLTPPQQHLARQMVHYWTTFAHHGTPNAPVPQAPHWPRYQPDRDNFLALRLPRPTVINDYGTTHHCDFWDTLTT
ncbi:carboxylesterase/lipase family protein, partial [Streptomyces sp. NPDC056296]|uniref:carboxylesterase/lipase family protein n=1 Tax=Streptomyces sp. NPDC056296 TaxID=3345775 RepID=UPI0035E27F20